MTDDSLCKSPHTTPSNFAALSLKGRSAIVTGAARGIGFAAVQRLQAEGVDVLAVDLKSADFSDLDDLSTNDTARVVSLKADVVLLESWLNIVKAADRAFGRIDILFSNAGISGNTHPVSRYDEDMFDKVMAVNARAVFLGLKHVGLYMSERQSGVIVNVSSISGMGGGGNVFAYTASKHAVIGMTKSAAVHYAPSGVRVVCLCPCPTDTEMMAYAERMVSPDNPEAARPILSQGIPLGRYCTVEEIANVLAFVVSDQASFLTGTIIPVDGGVTAR